MGDRLWNVYLAGEIHSSWRQDIQKKVINKSIPVRLMGPETDHDTSDHCGDRILGSEKDKFWHDHKAAKINTIRNRGIIKNCDILVVHFGDKFRQWNAAYDVGYASALGHSIITLHDAIW